MEIQEYTTKKGTKCKIKDLNLCKIITLPYGMGICRFTINDLKKIGLQKGNKRWYLSIEDKTDWGEKTKKKHTSLDNAIDYLEEMKTQIRSSQPSRI
tara:strand:- start:8 stop:298 length:291 start_codon:yes stop_codon:yes gene_type:complete